MTLRAWYRIARAIDTALLAAALGFARWDRTSARCWLALALYAVGRARRAVDRLEQAAR